MLNSPRRWTIVAVAAVAGLVLDRRAGFEGAFGPVLLGGVILALLVPARSACGQER